ncbi:MAG: hypothetical protein IJ228_11955 [Succinivibrio sp.]|nr:hypothetical protein [Succinivibrio sp.]
MNTLTKQFWLGLALGVIAGAVGYKVLTERKLINPHALERTVQGLADKLKGEKSAAQSVTEGGQGHKKGGHGHHQVAHRA